MKASPKNNTILSVIVLNYNSGLYLSNCLKSILASTLGDYSIEVIIADNASTDFSFSKAQKIKNSDSKIKFIFYPLAKNIGFSAGNNQALKKINPQSKHVLFLNPDTIVNVDTFKKMLDFFKYHPDVDAATCNLILALTGKTQPESHRGFPTPGNSFWHFFGFGLPKLFPKSKLFNGYFLGHLNYQKVQKIDACVGAFLMVKKEAGDAIGWWNEKYFFYGEDLDFCWQLKKHAFSLYFYPGCSATHFQGISSGIISHSQNKSAASRDTKIRSAIASTEAMKIFYKENLMSTYPQPLHPIINLGINLLEKYRLFRAKYL